MVSIQAALKRIKSQHQTFLPEHIVNQFCEKIGYTFRNRVLGPAETFCLFFLQILHGNIACSALRIICGSEITASAYCQARQRLPLEFFSNILKWMCEHFNDITSEDTLWNGHRVFLVDGSCFSMPDTPELQSQFPQPCRQKPGCGFPVGKFLLMINHSTGMIRDLFTCSLNNHELSQVHNLHPQLKEKDVLVGDRGFCSYIHIALLFMRKIHPVMRIHQRMITDFTPNRPHGTKNTKSLPRTPWIKALGKNDQLVWWLKPKKCPSTISQKMFEKLPDKICVRELQYEVIAKGYRSRTVKLVTTLLDSEKYSLEDLAKLYMQRWQIEVNLRDLKTTMGLDVLKCKSVEGVLKELYMFMMVYNMIQTIRMRSAAKQNVEYHRISFIDALRWLKQNKLSSAIPDLLINISRPTRKPHPRVLKRRRTEYTLMTKPRNEYLTNDTAIR